MIINHYTVSLHQPSFSCTYHPFLLCSPRSFLLTHTCSLFTLMLFQCFPLFQHTSMPLPRHPTPPSPSQPAAQSLLPLLATLVHRGQVQPLPGVTAFLEVLPRLAEAGSCRLARMNIENSAFAFKWDVHEKRGAVKRDKNKQRAKGERMNDTGAERQKKSEYWIWDIKTDPLLFYFIHLLIHA